MNTQTISKETKSMNNETFNSLTIKNALLLNKIHLCSMTKQIQSNLILSSQGINTLLIQKWL